MPDLRALGQASPQDSRDVDRHPCHTQAAWIRRSFLVPSFLGLEGNVRPKLLTITTTTTIDFTIQIKSIFFIVIIFISNLIILENLIIFIILIIILNLFSPSFYSF